MKITIPETTITLPKPRHLKWALLAALALVAAVLATHTAEPFALSLTPQAAAAPAAAFPGANGKIAFASQRDGSSEIFVMDADGSGPTNRTNNAGFDLRPAWSPDGSQIAFDSNGSGDFEIYVMNADGSGQTNLTNNAAGDFGPAWSPDGSQIAFFSSRDGNNEIYVMNADGSGQTNLTNTSNAEQDHRPSWSPDGTQIAFDTTRDGNGEIYLMNADGSGQTNLTNNAAADFEPTWSPDGTQIAFESTRDGNNEIFVMDADGSGPTNLTNNAAADGVPSWSPNGTNIAFQSFRDGNNEIYVMNTDGTGQTNLTNDASSDTFPDWGPVPPISITKLGQYALPKTCFGVLDAAQSQLFTVCDNDFQGAPDASAVCISDGVCEDEDPAPGKIKVTVDSGEYHVVEIKPPVNHAADSTKYTCDTDVGCGLTSTNEPLNDPWFPWDLTGDGVVSVGDIQSEVQHFGELKPAP